ncbi:hypothetical protein [Embleya sp. NPDC005971]|uniref:hypothetical protein n=1 Tax=Embleya sp. NPDC005971 TaxID=3156724 RepID=UPI00340CFDF1
MSTRETPSRDGDGVDEDAVVHELYGLDPEEFVAARDARARTARAAGDRAAAGRIGGLRRPVLAAWLANLLVREQREEIDAFLELGAAMRAAQEQLHGAELRDLSRRRHRVIDALQREALALAAARGHPAVGDAARRDLQDTLNTALADPDAARMLADGRLTGPLHPDGAFGPTATAEPAARTPAVAERPGSHRTAERGRGSTPEAEEAGAEPTRTADRRADERARKRYEADLARARADAETARESAHRAARAAQERGADAEAARERHREADAAAEELARRLDESRTEAARLDEAADEAEAELARAQRTAHDASTVARTAQEHLDRLADTRPD